MDSESEAGTAVITCVPEWASQSKPNIITFPPSLDALDINGADILDSQDGTPRMCESGHPTAPEGRWPVSGGIKAILEEESEDGRTLFFGVNSILSSITKSYSTKDADVEATITFVETLQDRVASVDHIIQAHRAEPLRQESGGYPWEDAVICQESTGRKLRRKFRPITEESGTGLRTLKSVLDETGKWRFARSKFDFDKLKGDPKRVAAMFSEEGALVNDAVLYNVPVEIGKKVGKTFVPDHSTLMSITISRRVKGTLKSLQSERSDESS